MAQRVQKLLGEKDERSPEQGRNWLRSQAKRGTGIQENGTFRKALWQGVCLSVIPVLSEVIAFVDRDSNLELVMGEKKWLSHLWLRFFQSDKVVELHYNDFLSLQSHSIRERVPLFTTADENQTFKLQFPFSWLIKEKMDAMWKDASSIAGKTRLEKMFLFLFLIVYEKRLMFSALLFCCF